MKLNVNRKNLAAALKDVSYCIGSRTTMPILANVLFEAKENKITLTATNLEQRISSVVQVENIEEEGRTTLPARRLLQTLDTLCGDIVSITTNESNQYTEIISGKSKINLPGLSPDEFPSDPSYESKSEITVESRDLARLIESTQYACSTDDSRKVLQGVMFSSSENEFYAVATDGKRLAFSNVTYTVPIEHEIRIIVPVSALKFLASLKSEKVLLTFNENMFTASAGDTIFKSKLIEGNYPNWKQVVPKEFKKSIEINGDEFRKVLKIVSLTKDTLNSNAKFKFGKNNILTVSSNSVSGESCTEMEFTGDSPDEDVIFTFNSDYVEQSVGSCGSFVLKYNDACSPVQFILPDNSFAIIMPMRK